MTITEHYGQGKALLRQGGIENPSLDASLLLAGALGLERSALWSYAERPVGEGASSCFRQYLERRLAGECVAYILGRKEFRAMDFFVTPDVLVPRADTETLVEAALNFLKKIEAREAPPKALDICTGSGAVAIALKRERPRLEVHASDISPAALEVAKRNAARLLPAGGQAPDPILFFQSDLFDGIPGPFDLITANPPYVPTAVLDSLAAEVRREPRLALDGGDDGLVLIRRIIAEAGGHLRYGGRLFLEADGAQIDAVMRVFERGRWNHIEIRRDLAGIRRVISAECP